MQTQHFAPYSKKAQLKIQQMAFVLVMLMIFFGIIALIFFTIWSADIGASAKERQEEEAFQIALALAGAPEFAFTSASDCSSCIDFEKIASLDQTVYSSLWNLDYLAVEIVYPVPGLGETKNITIIPRKPNMGSTSKAFVSLVRRDPTTHNFKYEIGKIIVSGGNAPSE